MELLCCERVSPGSEPRGPAAARAPPAAGPDPVLLRRRVLDNLLRTEERYAVTANYFGTVQTELTPHMRRVVAEWMLEVSAAAPGPRCRSPFCLVFRPRVGILLRQWPRMPCLCRRGSPRVP